MTFLGRCLADLVLAVAALGLVTFIRLYYASRTAAEVATDRLHSASFALAALVVISSVLVVRFTRLVSDDFILVTIALLFHTSLERKAVATWSWARETIPKLWNRFVFRDESENA
jgi:hypothetical protein